MTRKLMNTVVSFVCFLNIPYKKVALTLCRLEVLK